MTETHNTAAMSGGDRTLLFTSRINDGDRLPVEQIIFMDAMMRHKEWRQIVVQNAYVHMGLASNSGDTAYEYLYSKA